MKHAEREHSIVSPSTYERARNCPGWVFLSKDLVPSGDSPWAAWGTEAHEWSQKALTLALVKSKSPQSVYDEIEDDYMREMVEGFVESCIALYSRIRSIADKSVYFFIEEKVTISENTKGTIDFGILFRLNGSWQIIVKDLKTGKGVKVSPTGTQLPLYALGLSKSNYINEGDTVEGAHLYIYQPTFYDEPQKHKVSYAELLELEEELHRTEEKVFKILDNGKLAKGDLKAGDHCTFCPAQSICPEFRNRLLRETSLDMTELETGTNKMLPDFKRLPMEKLISAWRMKAQVESWLEQIEAYLKSCVRKNGVKGLKLVPGVKRRHWKGDEKKVAGGLVKLGVKNPYNKKLIGIREAEKVIGEKVNKFVESVACKEVLIYEEKATGAQKQLTHDISELNDGGSKAGRNKIATRKRGTGSRSGAKKTSKNRVLKKGGKGATRKKRV